MPCITHSPISSTLVILAVYFLKWEFSLEWKLLPRHLEVKLTAVRLPEPLNECSSIITSFSDFIYLYLLSQVGEDQQGFVPCSEDHGVCYLPAGSASSSWSSYHKSCSWHTSASSTSFTPSGVLYLGISSSPQLLQARTISLYIEDS